MNVNIRSNEYVWASVDVKVLGRVIKGIRAFEFRKSVEKEAIYGAGQTALDIQSGNITCEGSLTVMGFELDDMNKAARLAGYDDILSVPHEAVVITATFRKLAADPITTVVARGVAFTEMPNSMDQGAKLRECQLPFIAMDIQLSTLSL